MIDHMIENPNTFAPGTKMALFPRPDAKERADVILFLREKSDSPPLLPEPSAAPAAEAPAEGTPAEGEPAAGKAPGGEILALIAAADPKQGEVELALCKVCHTFDKGGATLIGPNLYGVVGMKIASHEGVTYTPALKAKEGNWTYENLDAWLQPASLRARHGDGLPASSTSRSAPQSSPTSAAMPRARSRCRKRRPRRTRVQRRPRLLKKRHRRHLPPRNLQRLLRKPPQRQSPQHRQRLLPKSLLRKRLLRHLPPKSLRRKHLLRHLLLKRHPLPRSHRRETPAAPEAAPSAETPPAAGAEPAPSEPSMGEPPSPSQPQPVYPDEEPAAEAPVTTDAVPAGARPPRWASRCRTRSRSRSYPGRAAARRRVGNRKVASGRLWAVVFG